MNKFGKLCVLLLVIFTITISAAQEAPKTMAKVTIKLVEPRPERPFDAQGKTLWRAGTKYARVEEAPDTGKGIHGLLIINEPDAWMINLFQKSGQHMVDTGPTFNARLPIFNARPVSTAKIAELEFGRELDFFTKNNAKPESETTNGTTTNRYEVTIDGRTLILWTGAESKKPLRVSLVHGEQTQTFEYVSYQDNLEFDPSLFRPPTGVAVIEPKH
jgi:outer membrane lipoprotein-sorting protein